MSANHPIGKVLEILHFSHSTSANCRNFYYLPFSSVHTCICLFDYTMHLFCILHTVCFLYIILKQWILLVFLI